MRGVGFKIPVMPQGAFYVFADASKFTDDSYYAELGIARTRSPSSSSRRPASGYPRSGSGAGRKLRPVGMRAVRVSYASSAVEREAM